MSKIVFSRLRKEQAGFGLIELLIAMTVLNVGLLALVASLNSGMFALSNSSRLSTASVLAERQLEVYRGVGSESVGLDQAAVEALYAGDALYACDNALRANSALPCSASNREEQVYVTGCGDPLPPECSPSRTVTGADGLSYRIDTYVVLSMPAASTPVRPVKLVTVVVRKGGDLSRVYVRHESTFDESA